MTENTANAVRQEFNPAEVYNGARGVYKNIDKRATQAKRTLMNCFYAALEELGYTEDEIANDTQKATRVAVKMYSSKYLGNKQYNKLLGSDTFYSNFEKASIEDKMYMHKAALGVGFSDVLGYVRQRGGLDDNLMLHAINKGKNDRVEDGLSAYLENKVDGKDNYAKLCKMDHNISKLDTGQMSYEDLASLAKKSIMGQTTHNGLEHMVGVEAKGYCAPSQGQYR